MDRRLALILLILLPALAQAQIGGFSLPGVGDLEKQITESAENSADGTNTDKKLLERTLELRREVDSNQQTIKDLETFARQAATQRARLNAELAEARQQQDKDWSAQYQDLSLQALVEKLTSRLDALEKNQSRLAEVNSELTRTQTLPEQAQNVISKAMERMDTIRSRLNEGTDENGEPTGYIGGYCLSGPCDSGSTMAGVGAIGPQTGCGAEGFCINEQSQQGVQSICYKSCSANTDCRSGYACEVIGFFNDADMTPAGRCQPACATNDDCEVYTLNDGSGQLNSFCNTDGWCEVPCNPNEANSCGDGGGYVCTARTEFNAETDFGGSCALAP